MKRLHKIIPGNYSSDFLSLAQLRIKHAKRDAMKQALKNAMSEERNESIVTDDKVEKIKNISNYMICTKEEADYFKKTIIDSKNSKTVKITPTDGGMYKVWLLN